MCHAQVKLQYEVDCCGPRTERQAAGRRWRTAEHLDDLTDHHLLLWLYFCFNSNPRLPLPTSLSALHPHQFLTVVLFLLPWRQQESRFFRTNPLLTRLLFWWHSETSRTRDGSSLEWKRSNRASDRARWHVAISTDPWQPLDSVKNRRGVCWGDKIRFYSWAFIAFVISNWISVVLSLSIRLILVLHARRIEVVLSYGWKPYISGLPASE